MNVAVALYFPAFTPVLFVYSTVTPSGNVPVISILCSFPSYSTVLSSNLTPLKSYVALLIVSVAVNVVEPA